MCPDDVAAVGGVRTRVDRGRSAQVALVAAVRRGNRRRRRGAAPTAAAAGATDAAAAAGAPAAAQEPRAEACQGDAEPSPVGDCGRGPAAAPGLPVTNRPDPSSGWQNFRPKPRQSAIFIGPIPLENPTKPLQTQ